MICLLNWLKIAEKKCPTQLLVHFKHPHLPLDLELPDPKSKLF